MSEHKHVKALAALMHRGQTDKAGEDYFSGHLTRVAEAMETYGEASAAYLHDIIEDTPTTTDDLLALGFSNDLVQTVLTLTRRGSESYDSYIVRVARSFDPVAIKVKLADLHDHLRDTDAIPVSLVRRYVHAIERLKEEVGQ